LKFEIQQSAIGQIYPEQTRAQQIDPELISLENSHTRIFPNIGGKCPGARQSVRSQTE
jgi:hypothetical protein